MNSDQWQSIIRTVLTLLLGPGSYLVLKGVLTADQAAQLIPVLVPVVLAVGGLLLGRWGVVTHSPSALTAAVNSDSVPGVKAVASSSPSPAVSVDPKTGAVKPIPIEPANSLRRAGGAVGALIVFVATGLAALMLTGGHGWAAGAGGWLPVHDAFEALGMIVAFLMAVIFMAVGFLAIVHWRRWKNEPPDVLRGRHDADYGDEPFM